jgi:hypothetical protein
LYSDGEALTHAAAESNRNGVVGNIGRNIPITPSASEMQPTMIKKIFIVAQMYKLLSLYHGCNGKNYSLDEIIRFSGKSLR